MRYVSAALCALLLASPLAAQCPDGTPAPCTRAAGPPSANSVAVLYFDARDTTDTFLAEGLSEEIATSLGHVPRLVVKIPSAVRRVQRASAGDLRAMGRALAVKWIVDGSVRRAGTQLRVSVRLVDAERETATWSNAFTRTQADLLAIQEDIAREVATGVVGALTPAERATVSARPTTNAEAYEHYLKGNWYLGRRGDWLARAVEEFETAARLDPSFAAPRAGISIAWISARDYGSNNTRPFGVARDTLAMRALALADSVVQRNPSLALGWLARGVALRSMNQLVAARQAIDRALTLEPNNVEANYRLGQLLWNIGEFKEANQRLLRALALDPSRAVTYHQLGVTAYFERRFADARRMLDSALTLDPSYILPLRWRVVVAVALGDSAAIRRAVGAYFRVTATDAGNGPPPAVISQLRSLADSVLAIPTMVGHNASQALASVGLHEAGLTQLGSALDIRVCRFVIADYVFDPVRRDPRFVEYERACLALKPT